MPLFDHFDILAPFYERFIKAKSPETLLQLTELPSEGFLLDAGGGTGRVSQYFREQVSHVVVADLSFDMLIQAQKKTGLIGINSHTEKFPFPDDTFNRIIMVDALHHVCDQVETAQELWRVLKPGGLLVIEEPDLRTLRVKLLAFAEKLALMRSHFLSPQQIMTLFDGDSARVRYEKLGVICWVIVVKDSSP
jgi:demethylmenaquinone methyltransferase/2-methoxy-6-polyprenyl-1,4-benzoquinol methylase